MLPGWCAGPAVAHQACAMVFNVLQQLEEGDPIHGVEDDTSKSAPLSGTTRGHNEFSFRFNLKPRLVVQPTNHVANVCRDFELM